MTCDLMVNYMENQDFDRVTLYFLIGYTWKDTENILENCKNVLENVHEKCLIFFLETCIHQDSIPPLSPVTIQDEDQCRACHRRVS